jgi:hypothetical protein
MLQGPGADIYGLASGLYDPFGTVTYQHPKTPADTLKYLNDSGLVAHAAEGGSIEDILQYLRS